MATILMITYSNSGLNPFNFQKNGSFSRHVVWVQHKIQGMIKIKMPTCAEFVHLMSNMTYIRHAKIKLKVEQTL